MTEDTTDLYAAAESLLSPEITGETPNPAEDQAEDVTDDVEDQDVEETALESDDAAETSTSEDDAEEASSDDEEIADDDTKEDADETQTFPVIVDGKEEQWTLEQLKQSASGQSAINKRFQEAAEMRKQIQTREAQLAQHEQNIMQAFQNLQNGANLRIPTPPSEEMLAQDPIGYLEADVRYKKEVAEYNQTVAQMQAVYQQQMQRAQEQEQAYLAEQTRLLSEAIPEYADPNTRDAFARSLLEVGKRYNFTQEEMAGVKDMRYVMALNDAKKYHDLIAKQTSAKAKAQQKPANAPIRAGAKKVAEPANAARKKAQDRLKRTGSIDDAIDLIFNS